MKTVYVDMVGDLFHYGHVSLLKKAKQLGDTLLVGVHTDEVVASYKRTPIMKYWERVQVIAACKFVDDVLLEAPIRLTKEFMDNHKIDLVVHGDDIDPDWEEYMYGIPISLNKFVKVPHTREIHTSMIIERCYEHCVKVCDYLHESIKTVPQQVDRQV